MRVTVLDSSINRVMLSDGSRVRVRVSEGYVVMVGFQRTPL